MNFNQESKSEDFLGGLGGGGEKEEGRGRDSDKKNRYLLIFCAHALHKISSS